MEGRVLEIEKLSQEIVAVFCLAVRLVCWKVFILQRTKIGITKLTVSGYASGTSFGNAFRECTNLTVVEITEGAEEVSQDMFNGMTSLTEVIIPDSVKKIDVHAFYNCTALLALTIPDSVTEIADNAFNGCANLKLFVPLDSYAERYAEQKGLSFEYTNVEKCSLEVTLDTAQQYAGSALQLQHLDKEGNWVRVSNLAVGEESVYTFYGLSAVVKPVTTMDKLKYKSGNKKVVSVGSSGKLTAKKAGKTTVTVSAGKKKYKITVTVKKKPATDFKLNQSTLSVKRKKTATLKAVFSPKNSEGTVKYASSDKKVATVTSAGKVKGISKGKAVITATMTLASGKKVIRTCQVTVK